MLKQVNGRNQRAKGLRVKHVLQICVLVAVSIWLLYQVKHSHDKKKAFEERNSKILLVEESHSETFKFGRKDLPYIVETNSITKDHVAAEENEEGEEADKEVDKDDRDEDAASVEAGEYVTDEQDQEKADEEADRIEEFNEEEGKAGGAEELNFFDNQEHGEGSQEAREETFKSDDASSAVFDITQTAKSESENGGARKLDEGQLESLESKGVETENTSLGTNGDSKLNGSIVIGLKDGFKISTTIQSNSLTMNESTASERRESEVESSNLKVESNSNSTLAESNNWMEPQVTTAMANVSSNHMEVQTNSTATTITISNIHMDPQGNTTAIDTETNAVTMQDESSISESVQGHTATQETGASGEDDSTLGSTVIEQIEKLNTHDILKQSEENSTTVTYENIDTAQKESRDILHNAGKEENDAGTEVSMLPAIQTDAKKDEAAA